MTRRLAPDELRELLGAYAVDALAPWEAAQVEELVDDDPAARTEVELHHQALAVLASEVTGDAAPPRGLWDTIAAGLADAPPPLRLVPAADAPARRRVTTWLAPLAAAAAIAAVALFGVQALTDDTPTLDDAAQAVAQADGSEVVTLQGEGGVTVDIALGADGLGYVYQDALPALPAGRTYQLWAVVNDEVISAAVLGADPGVAPFQIEGTVAVFAVTEEVAGGVAVSANQPVAVWQRGA